jgi:predicted esterase
MRSLALIAVCLVGCGADLPQQSSGEDLAVDEVRIDVDLAAVPAADLAAPPGDPRDLAIPPPPPDLSSVPRLPMRTGAGTFAISGRTETAIRVAVPSPLPPSPPIVIAFHGTGDEPSGAMSDSQLEDNARKYGFVAIAPRAGYRNGGHPADVDHEANSTGSSWNMWNLDPNTNEDLRYVVALIAAAKATYDADTTRVYTLGFSNGAFMSYFVAASLPDVIAGFGEHSGGWTTDSCPTRYGADSAGLSFYPTSGPAPGVTTTCAALYASMSPKFPSTCIPTATNLLRPPRPGARVPFGYLGHYTSDDIVSVAWTCYLSTALGARATTTLRWSTTDGTSGHNVAPDFFDKAWTFFALRTNTQ